MPRPAAGPASGARHGGFLRRHRPSPPAERLFDPDAADGGARAISRHVSDTLHCAAHRAAIARPWFGTDMLDATFYSRVSMVRGILAVGFSVATLASIVGLAIGLFSGFVRWRTPSSCG